MTTIYTFNSKVLKNTVNDKWLIKKFIDPYNPLNLPANTVRVRTSDGNAPIKNTGLFATTYDTATLVAGTTDVYDVYKSGTNFRYFLSYSSNVVEILGANTTGITNMNGMFFDTPLTAIPLFDTSNVTNMDSMFYHCVKVQTGALAFYNQVSTQATPPSSHSRTFWYCGSDTVTGAAELAEIPSDWK